MGVTGSDLSPGSEDPAPSARYPIPPDDEFGMRRFVDLVTKSGGYPMWESSKKDMAAAVSELMKMVSSPYWLSFEGRTVGNDVEIQVPGRRPRPILYRGVRLLSR